MNRIKQMLSVALVLAFAGLSLTAQAQVTDRPYRGSTQQVRQLIQRIEDRTATFRTSLEASLNQSSYDNTRAEDNVNLFVSDFTSSVQRLHDRFDRRQSTASDVQDVLNRASRIDSFIRRTRLGGGVAGDWAALRADLNELAQDYNITWRWNSQANTTSNNYPLGNYPTNNYPTNNYPSGNRGYANRLTGTYQLDTTRSDDARNIANNATRSLPYRDRQRVLDSLTARLESPTTLAIDLRGRNVTIASTRRAQFSFDADGIEHVETSADGQHEVRVRATLSGDQLAIASSGDRDRESDFNVTFEPIEGGRSLRVTRRISNISLNAPVTVVSVYQRTSEVAQLDIYNGSSNYPGTGTVASSGDFIVPDGTEIVAVLNNNLTTRDTRENDRFTMTVHSPSQYDGATINGYITNINRSGRATGRSQLTLNFDSITMRNGRTYKFAGITESVQTASGETVRVDNEGAVKDNNRTTTTEKRAAIGTGIGAIIGAIAGGGKGAAIGAVVGAGAGAGSVYAEGRDDLELLSGTQVTVRASGPR